MKQCKMCGHYFFSIKNKEFCCRVCEHYYNFMKKEKEEIKK